MNGPDPHAVAAIRAWYRLDRAFAGVNRWLWQTYCVTGTQVAIARIVAERDTWVLADLRQRLTMHPATLGQALNRLEARGFMRITVDPSDGRRRLVALTDQGRILIADIPLVGPVRLRTTGADLDDLDALADAFNRAVELFGVLPWADDPDVIDTKEKTT
ncbi:MAG: winged helix DNA-binding protein [Propionibacteriaceae bacterium]|nr:winged helix DNA-binding protein [Propionibacteriaceae bacterium]